MQNKKNKQGLPHHKSGAGFTLIELLVVIAIIGLLASVVLVSLNSTRVKARDTKRKADISQFQKALELYYDANGQYPASGGATIPTGWNNSNDSSWTTLQTALSAFLPKLPQDPKQDASGWSGGGQQTYAYYSGGYGCPGQWYMIVYRLETAEGTDPGVTACDNTFFQYGGGGGNIKTVGLKAK